MVILDHSEIAQSDMKGACLRTGDHGRDISMAPKGLQRRIHDRGWSVHPLQPTEHTVRLVEFPVGVGGRADACIADEIAVYSGAVDLRGQHAYVSPTGAGEIQLARAFF